MSIGKNPPQQSTLPPGIQLPYYQPPNRVSGPPAPSPGPVDGTIDWSFPTLGDPVIVTTTIKGGDPGAVKFPDDPGTSPYDPKTNLNPD